MPGSCILHACSSRATLPASNAQHCPCWWRGLGHEFLMFFMQTCPDLSFGHENWVGTKQAPIHSSHWSLYSPCCLPLHLPPVFQAIFNLHTVSSSPAALWTCAARKLPCAPWVSRCGRLCSRQTWTVGAPSLPSHSLPPLTPRIPGLVLF